jgi:hypothetical protein
MESATFCTNPTRTPKREQEQGCEEGLKDRPCAIVMAVVDEASEQQVLVLPITHTPPENEEDAVEIPATTKTRLGVGGDDGERSWIVISEANAFIWPSPDLRDVPGRDEPSIVYGTLPSTFFAHVRDRFLERDRSEKSMRVTRTD